MSIGNEEYEELYNKWKEIGFNKWSGIEHFLIFGIMEALVLDICDIKYVSTSYSEYPSFRTDLKYARIIYQAAVDAIRIAKLFNIPERLLNEGDRAYIGRIGDEFAQFSNKYNLIYDPVLLEVQNGDFAADKFVEIAIRNK